jgi:hypothetical protein
MHSHACQFFDNFGLFIQGILGLICFSALIFKRYIEKPQRPWIIWFFDSFKQVMGQGTQHLSNLYLADKIGQNRGLECEWYFNSLVTDCTIGVFICYLFLMFALCLVKNTSLEFKSGEYGQTEQNPDGWRFKSFLYQLMWWIIIVILAKLTMIGLIFIFYNLFEKVGSTILEPVKYNPKMKLIFVMIIFPIIFNIIQFWFTDNFIKINNHTEEKKNETDVETKDEKPNSIKNEILKNDNNKDVVIKLENTDGYKPISQNDKN